MFSSGSDGVASRPLACMHMYSVSISLIRESVDSLHVCRDGTDMPISLNKYIKCPRTQEHWFF